MYQQKRSSLTVETGGDRHKKQSQSGAWLLFYLLLSLPFDIAAEDKPLRILRVTPSGQDVPAGKQIVIQFNQPVVPLGRMARTADEIPVTIIPEVKCQWRWLNQSALACHLDDKTALPPSHKYAVVVQAGQVGITTQTGKTLAEPYMHSFITERVRVRSAYFRTWKAPGWPVIRMVFNQPVSRDSVARHVFLAPKDEVNQKGATQRYPITVSPDPNEQKLPRFFRVPGEGSWLDLGKEMNRKSHDELDELDELIEVNGQEARRVWLVKPTG